MSDGTKMTTHRVTGTAEGLTYNDLSWLIEKMDEEGASSYARVGVEFTPQDGPGPGIVSLYAEFPGT